ncbi:MAG TPA: hypothetical protein PKZ09_06275, partial [Bacillota bacterium]|nr:hypothetical protein [Bacillota bacterium]
MQAAVMDSVRTEPATFDLPNPQDVLYPDFQFSTSPDLGSALSTAFVVDTAAKADWAIGRILSLEA